jgi:hypothetical protein
METGQFLPIERIIIDSICALTIVLGFGLARSLYPIQRSTAQIGANYCLWFSWILVFFTKVSIAIVFFLFGAALLLREQSIAPRERELAFFYDEDKRIAAELDRLTFERMAAESAEKAAETELQRQIYGIGSTRAGYGPQARAAEDARRKSVELKQSLMARTGRLPLLGG